MSAYGRSLLPLVIAAATAIGHAAAYGAGFQLFEQNASGLGNAYAGQAASAEDASTIYFNPAGLAHVPRRQLVGALHLIRPSAKFSNTGSCSPYLGAGAGTSTCPLGQGGNLGHPFGNEGGDAGDLAAVPNFYLSWELVHNRLWLGVGVNAPFGLTTEWDRAWMGRFHAIKSEVQTVNINPSVAWKINEAASVGGGLSAQRLKTTLDNAVSYRAVALASGNAALIAATPAGAEGVATVDGDDWGWGWNAGVLVNVTPATRLGISYRSKLKYRVEGDVHFDNRPPALGVVPQVADGNVQAHIDLPDMWSVALAHQATPKLQLLADWTRTGWSSIQDLTIVRTSGALAGQTLTNTPLHFKNTWRVGLGANYQLTPAWKLRAGIAYDKGNTSDPFRTPRLPDADRRWFTAGAQWALAPDVVFDVGYAYISNKDASSNLPNQETATSAPRGSLVGNYSADVHILGAQVRWSF